MNIKSAINNRIKKLTAITPSTWRFYLPIFRLIPKLGPYFSYPIIGPLLKWAAMVFPIESRHTQTYVLNLNEDVTDKAQGVTLPIEMMKQVIRESSYRVIMDKCLCRSAHGCTDFPHDHACIFVGQGARAAVLHGVGHEAGVEEALAHIDKASELGLIGQALWIEFEQYVWGITDEGMPHWLEICFCCPCCCSAFQLSRSTSVKDITGRFRSIGWKATVDQSECTLCARCAERCPVKAISIQDDRLLIDELSCLGCGFCAAHCPESSIKLHLRDPLKGTIQDYFAQGGLQLHV
jgi:Pyruvate/2-oxoacid:ferredoxin oxidoreductase delta subunit